MRYLAIDYGRKRTGLAICDRQEIIASPLAVIDSIRQLISKIIEVVNRENVDGIVLGLPLNMDGSVGPQAQLVLKFADKLKQHLQIPVHFQDERLTTFSAEKESPGGVGKKKKKQKPLDAVAAAAILQDFLDAKKNP